MLKLVIILWQYFDYFGLFLKLAAPLGHCASICQSRSDDG